MMAVVRGVGPVESSPLIRPPLLLLLLLLLLLATVVMEVVVVLARCVMQSRTTLATSLRASLVVRCMHVSQHKQ